MAGLPTGAPVETASLLALVVAGLFALVALYRLDGRRDPAAPLRRRLVLGFPWGSAVVVVGVLAVYLFVQGAAGSLRDPLVVPFRSWSYFYPLGMLTAPFAHADLGHLTGNLLATVVLAPVAEYGWSHFATERGSLSFGSLRTNPFARAGAFVLAAVAVGIATSLFVPGPLVGFSGVVFAFAGFALLTVPLLAILAIVAQRVVGLVYYAALDPVVTADAGVRFVEPWWSNVAVHGHAFGLLVGALLGAAVVIRRGDRPDVRYVWFGTLVFAASEALYAFYWYLGTDRYVLFRGAGTALVLVLVTLVAAAVAGSDRSLVPRSGLSTRHIAGGLVLAVVFGIAIAAVPYNLADVEPADAADGITVRDYTVTYAEDVPNGYVSAVEIPVVGEPLAGGARASGVIVTSDRRNVWEEVIPAGELAHRGRATVSVGGLGWRERVVANRTAWNAVDGGSAYTVYLRRPGEPRRRAFASRPVALSPTVAGLNFTIEPVEGDYRLNATRNGTVVGRAAVPAPNGSARLGNVTVSRRGSDLYAVHGDTRIRVAAFEVRSRRR